MNKKVRFITLGCKVNHYETQAMRESLAGVGVCEPPRKTRNFEEPMDFVVINTCTVTRAADKENIYWVRRARRENPKAKIIVTGCFAERNRRELEEHPEIDLVLGNQDKAEIADYLTEGCGVPEIQDTIAQRERRHRFTPLQISKTEGCGRAYLKIQDGCNHACSFCKVVLVRGRSRSRPLHDIVEEAERLSLSGYREIVLAGIQLGAYGLDAPEQTSVADVLGAVSRVEGIERIRLSSIEPTDVTDDLIAVMRDNPKACPHLHIPLQSGDDAVLKSMNRRYARSLYLDLIGRLKAAMPDFCLSLDVMAGFPGETETCFQNTIDLLKQVKPVKSHVFPYSRREGTKASRMVDLPDSVIRDRVAALISLGDGLASQAASAFIGQTVQVLVEKKAGKRGLLQGLTANYLKVCFQGRDSLIGNMVPVKLLTYQGALFLGTMQGGSHD